MVKHDSQFLLNTIRVMISYNELLELQNSFAFTSSFYDAAGVVRFRLLPRDRMLLLDSCMRVYMESRSAV